MTFVKWLFLFLFPLLLHAQLGLRDPAYIASAGPPVVTPITFSNLWLWWRSTATGSNYNVNDPVDKWTNSAPGGVATNLVLDAKGGTARPVFSNNVFNSSIPAVCFDGVNDAFSVTNGNVNGWRTLSMLRPFTVVIIGRFMGPSVRIMASADNFSEPAFLGGAATNSFRFYRDPVYPTANVGISFSNAFMAVLQSRSSPAENRFYNDLQTTTNGTTSIDVYFDTCGSDSVNGIYGKWAMGEVMVFTNHYLSGLEVTNLYNNYAKPKYGLP